MSGISRTLLRASGIFALMMGLFAMSMVVILTTAHYWDKVKLPKMEAAAPLPAAESAPPPVQQNAKTSAPGPYGLADWPNSPARRISHGRQPTEANQAASPRVDPASIGVSVEQLRATVAAGNKIYLPAPKGECKLSGNGSNASLNGLDSCFAAQAAK